MNTSNSCALWIQLELAKELAKIFHVAGSGSEPLYGACEAMFKPDMEQEDLFEPISEALLSSVDRDCLNEWGCHFYVLTPTEVERTCKAQWTDLTVYGKFLEISSSGCIFPSQVYLT
ncbi:proteasome subunit beta type-3-A isoform X1 [Rosa chinensis]|uniref:proteasome subunit beta type-3-A isoform X1 n=1 Tax=Rosa chinensis TaxID=74649 RepID=UPI000D08C8D0|nr:proteasome subunit beta type-3-A isoform X1 [Rosa chinensis]XP_024183855.1 proteasome subunit beta type-3-A isoform X1 [Rosa chinensis]XP_024183856.1 proteasome subunit beta type-3-A isoform X1 [Rosa chinensis]